MAPKEKICMYCGKHFTPKNSKAYFCKTSHRVAFYKRKKRRMQQQELKIAHQNELEELHASAARIMSPDNQQRQKDIEWLKQHQEKESNESKELRQNDP